MPETITAEFDGNVIVPDSPLKFAAGQRLRVQIEVVGPDSYPLEEIGELATDMGVTDLADRHQHYASDQHFVQAGFRALLLEDP